MEFPVGLVVLKLVHEPRIRLFKGSGVEVTPEEVGVVGEVVLRDGTAAVELGVQARLVEAGEGTADTGKLVLKVARGRGAAACLPGLITVIHRRTSPHHGRASDGHGHPRPM